jgi:hypothetical protein
MILERPWIYLLGKVNRTDKRWMTPPRLPCTEGGFGGRLYVLHEWRFDFPTSPPEATARLSGRLTEPALRDSAPQRVNAEMSRFTLVVRSPKEKAGVGSAANDATRQVRRHARRRRHQQRPPYTSRLASRRAADGAITAARGSVGGAAIAAEQASHAGFALLGSLRRPVSDIHLSYPKTDTELHDLRAAAHIADIASTHP